MIKIFVSHHYYFELHNDEDKKEKAVVNQQKELWYIQNFVKNTPKVE
jgi:hypothetical protein